MQLILIYASKWLRQKKIIKHQGVGIVGAGLVGGLTALAFAAKGFSVTLFDLCSDPKKVTNEKNLRSINLAVSDRGIRALKYVDARNGR